VHDEGGGSEPLIYPIRGLVSLIADHTQYYGQGINLSLEGITFRTERPPPLGTLGVLTLIEDGFPEEITADVRITEVLGDLVHGIFISAHPVVVRLVAWLIRRK
jgi:hypothetical protein